MDTNSEQQVDVSFITKDDVYAIPSTQFMIPASATAEKLDEVIKAVIRSAKDRSDLDEIEFDFLINEKLVRHTIAEQCLEENIALEKQIEIEYFVKSSPPEPHNSFLHDDWVASVDTLGEWVLTGCYDGTVHIWNVKSGKHQLSFAAHPSTIKAVKWIRQQQQQNSGTHQFVTGSYDESAALWTWNSSDNSIRQASIFIGHVRSVDCLDQHSDLVASGSYDRLLKIWSLAPEKSADASVAEGKAKLVSPVMTLDGHKEAITGLTFIKSDDSEASLATCSMDNTIKIWDIETRERKQLLNSNKAFLDIAYSAQNGLLLTASCDRHIRCWDPRVRDGVQVKSVFTSHTNWISSVAWQGSSSSTTPTSNPNLFISGSYDSCVKQWDLRSTSAPLFDMTGHRDKVLAVDWSNADYMVSGAADNHIKVFACKN